MAVKEGFGTFYDAVQQFFSKSPCPRPPKIFMSGNSLHVSEINDKYNVTNDSQTIIDKKKVKNEINNGKKTIINNYNITINNYNCSRSTNM